MRSRQGVKQVLQDPAGNAETFRTDDLSPMLLDLRDTVAGVLEGTKTPQGWEDEFGATIAGVRSALEVSQLLELADELRGRSEAELRLGGEVGQTDTVNADVAKDVQVRLSLGSRGEQLDSEFAQEAPDELAHRESVLRQVL